MSQKIEAFIGLCVVIAASIFIFILLSKGNMGISGDYYPVRAHFSNISGISEGAEVRISGVKIGSVKQARLNSDNYQAELVMVIDKTIKLPIDSTIKIVSDSLLGGASIQIEAGFEEKHIKPNGLFMNTQSAVGLMELISKALFSSGS